VPRSSAFRHRNSTEDVTAIGRALGADYILTGQITTRSGTMRIRAELIDVATGTQQWSERFDQPLDDTLAVETEITHRLVDALRLQITGEEQAALARQRPVNAEAHAACLEGRFWWNKRTPEGLQRAIDLYKKAVLLDPKYAMAHTELGKAYLVMGAYSHPPNEVMPLAYEALQRAIEIDPGLSEPHAALSMYLCFYDWDWAAAEASFKLALQLDPDSALAHHWYSQFLVSQGRWDESQAHIDRAVAIEPGSSIIRNSAADPALFQRDFDRAARLLEQALERDQTFLRSIGNLGIVNFQRGLRDEAIEQLQQCVTAEGASNLQLGWLGYYLGRAGRRAEALEELQRIDELARHRYVPAYAFAQIYAGLGDADRVFEFLDRAFNEHFISMAWLRVNGDFEPYRDDPRYDELLRRIGLPLDPPDLPQLNFEIPRPSVAVLPFEMTGVDPDAAYLADEIPASVIDALSNISFLHVIPRSSSFRLRGSTDTIPEIGKALDADFVLTGQIVPRGDDLRIRAELVSVRSNQQLWGDRMDRSASDTLLIETDITDRIIDALKLPVSGAELQSLARRRPVNAEAHAAYLEGHFWWNKRTPKGLDRAIELYDKAIEIDPQYALAHAGLAETYVLMGTYSGRAHDSMPEALASAERAIELDSMLAAPHAVLGQYHSLYSWDWAAAEVAYARAIELDPDYATAHQWFADCLTFLGRLDESQTLYDRAAKLEPSSMIIQVSTGIPAYMKRQFTEAQLRFKVVLAMDPNFSLTHVFLGETLLGQGRFDEAIEQYRLAILREDAGAYILGALGRAYGLAGRREEALQELQRLTKLSETRIVPHSALAEVYFGLGDLDQAFALLDLAADEREFNIVLLKFDPAFDAARHDPRFDALLKRVGFPDDPPAPKIDPIKIPLPVIAVLPFEMTRENEDADFLADEIPASVIDSLSSLAGVRVVPRSSSFRHRDSTATIQEIGEALKADFVLTGQIVPRGDDLRIRSELVSVRTGRQLFSERLDRSAGDTLLVETELTDRIIDALKLPVSSAESQSLARRRPVNAEAHTAYLEGRFWWNKRTPEGLDQAIELYDKAVAIDPQYALAHAGRAETFALMSIYSRRPHEVMPQALDAANRAIELDPLLAAPHAVLGAYHEGYKYDWVAAEAAYLRAIELDPSNATAHHWYADYLAFQGRGKEAIDHIQRAVSLEPGSMAIQRDTGLPYLHMRDYESALRHYETALARDPDFLSTRSFMGQTLLLMGRGEEAIKQYEQVVARLAQIGQRESLFLQGELGYAYGMTGHREQALAALKLLQDNSTQAIVSQSSIAMIYIGLGDHDQAIAYFERGFQEREYLIATLKFNPLVDSIRNDPRFQDLLDRIGFPDDPPAPVVDP
ncbi:MAG: tetratricopeptide repeat protein, partial [Planctomycetes bacterium]|nr:tetratricopeptide repeat protein [Planctomycetota bacterium]